jgi:hypothetical protein
VLVSDATGRPVMGHPVAFVVTAGDGATLTPDTTMTGADGRAGARWVLGRNVGTQRAKAELVTTESTAAGAVVFSASASPGSAAVLARVSGDDQSARAGSPLPDSLVVRAEDQFGNPVSGVQVNWTVTGGGSVTPARVTTAADGRAAVRRVLGSQVGEQGASASASGLSGSPVAFSHSATSGGGGLGGGDEANVTIVSGDDQTGPPGAQLPDPLVIRVTDGDGNGVSGASVVWAVTEGGGSVQPALTVTDGGGRASTRWTLGPNEGRNRVTAIVAGIGSVELEARARRSGGNDDGDDRVVRLSFLVQPSDAKENERFSPTVAVAAVNAAGSPVASADGEVELRLGREEGDDARLRGDTRRRLEDGVATFPDLKVDDAEGTFTLIASAGGLPDVESAPFRIHD